MSAERFSNRREKLLKKLKAVRVDALLVTSVTNVSYLTDFSGDDSYLLIGRGLTVLISDSRYTTQIQDECPGLDVVIRRPGQLMNDTLDKVVRRAKLKALGIESSSTTVDVWQRLADKVKPLAVTPVAGLVEELRLVKDKQEIESIREAVREAEQGFGWLKASLWRDADGTAAATVAGTLAAGQRQPSRGGKESRGHGESGAGMAGGNGSLSGSISELRAAHELEHAMRRYGALRASFEPIVAAGARSALPHARATSAPVGGGGFVLFDWGASDASGYKSDLTRVLATDKISPKLAKIYRVVLKAQRRAIEAVRPGARCADVDAAAREVIAKAGYGKNFGHGVGHGIGLEIHEGPRLNPTSKETLAAGMVVTIEPGIYLPGWGGVRIEDDVLVTRSGHEVLTSLPTELE